MPLYAELQIDKERIIYPVPVPQGKEHYKIVRLLSGSTLYDRKYPRQPLYLFNGEMLWANEMRNEPEIQTTEIIVRPGDSEAKEQAESTMNKMVEAMKKSLLDAAKTMPEEKKRVVHNALAVADVATKSAAIIKEHAENPDGNLFDKIGQVAEDAGLIKPKKQFESGGFFGWTKDGFIPGPNCPDEIRPAEFVSPASLDTRGLPTIRIEWENDLPVVSPLQEPFAFSGGFIHIPPATESIAVPETIVNPKPVCPHKDRKFIRSRGTWCFDCRKFISNDHTKEWKP